MFIMLPMPVLIILLFCCQKCISITLQSSLSMQQTMCLKLINRSSRMSFVFVKSLFLYITNIKYDSCKCTHNTCHKHFCHHQISLSGDNIFVVEKRLHIFVIQYLVVSSDKEISGSIPGRSNFVNELCQVGVYVVQEIAYPETRWLVQHFTYFVC